MKTLAMILTLTGGLLRADDNTFLQAIAEVESGNDPYAVGKAGEVSQYQILPINWVRYTTRPLADASRGQLAKAVALKHLTWMRKQMRKADPKILDEQLRNPFTMALAWRYGPSRRYPTHLSHEMVDYASRVRNICYEISGEYSNRDW